MNQIQETNWKQAQEDATWSYQWQGLPALVPNVQVEAPCAPNKLLCGLCAYDLPSRPMKTNIADF